MRLKILIVYLVICFIAFLVLGSLIYSPPSPLQPQSNTTIPQQKSSSLNNPTGHDRSHGIGSGSPHRLTHSNPAHPEPSVTSNPAPSQTLAPSQIPYLSDIIPFVPLVGAIGVVSKFVKDWREEIVLGIDSIRIKTHSSYVGNRYLEEPTYCLRIKNKRRNGRGESCEGRIGIKGTDVDHSTLWSDNNQRYINISLIADLILFRVSELNNRKEIVFIVTVYPEQNANIEIRKSLEEYNGKKLAVRIGSANAHVPKPYIKSINKIIKESKEQMK